MLTTEEQALVLIRGIAGEITAALMDGSSWTSARHNAFVRHRAAWERDHGRDVVDEAWCLLDRKMGPAAFLTPYGAEKAGLDPPKSDHRHPISRSKKAGPHWFWLVLQWVANWR